MATKICPHCKQKFDSDRLGKIFCSKLCQTREHSIQTYYRIKNNPEYKKKRAAYFKIWRAKNREHFNELMRVYSKRFQAERRANRKAQGLCPGCGGEKIEDRYKQCEVCRAIDRRNYAKKNKG